MPLMRVRHPLAARPECVSPDEWFAGKSAARGKFPLRLSWQALASPLRVGECILVGNLDNRKIIFSADIAIRTIRMAPVGAVHIRPPLKMIVERHRSGWWREHDTPRYEIFRFRV